jgi:hypothetical protein
LTTLDYFRKRKWRLCDYHRQLDELKWIFVDCNSEIQPTDLYAVFLEAAMIPDRFGNYEAGYLEKTRHQVRKSAQGKISGFGITAISADNDPQSFKSWLDGLAKKGPKAHHTNRLCKAPAMEASILYTSKKSQ